MAILIGHSLLLWHGTGNQFFDEAGHATKCYVLTRDGKVSFHELGHTIDPETGLKCRADYTPAMLERLKEYEAGKHPIQIYEENPVFFEPRTGDPIISVLGIQVW